MDFNAIEFKKKIGSNIMRMYISINDILAGETDAKTLKKLKFVRKLLVKQKEKKRRVLSIRHRLQIYFYFLSLS